MRTRRQAVPLVSGDLFSQKALVAMKAENALAKLPKVKWITLV
jgi:hypothetical protein